MQKEKSLIPLFVYGTLKRCFSNYYYYLTSSKFVGRAVSKDKYELRASGIPFCLRKNPISHIHGELFLVSWKNLRRIDGLEGHPYAYRRRPTVFRCRGQEVRAWIYFYNRGSEIRGLRLLKNGFYPLTSKERLFEFFLTEGFDMRLSPGKHDRKAFSKDSILCPLVKKLQLLAVNRLPVFVRAQEKGFLCGTFDPEDHTRGVAVMVDGEKTTPVRWDPSLPGTGRKKTSIVLDVTSRNHVVAKTSETSFSLERLPGSLGDVGKLLSVTLPHFPARERVFMAEDILTAAGADVRVLPAERTLKEVIDHQQKHPEMFVIKENEEGYDRDPEIVEEEADEDEVLYEDLLL